LRSRRNASSVARALLRVAWSIRSHSAVQLPLHAIDAPVRVVERGLGILDGLLPLRHRVILDRPAGSSAFFAMSFAVDLLPEGSGCKAQRRSREQRAKRESPDRKGDGSSLHFLSSPITNEAMV